MLFLLCFALSAPPCGAVSTQSPPKDGQFDGFCRDYIAAVLALYPETAGQLGLSEKMGFTRHMHRFSDSSPTGTLKEFNGLKSLCKKLRALDRKPLTYAQRLSADIMDWYLTTRLKRKPFKHHHYVIDHMLGFHNHLVSVFTLHHRVQNRGDAQDYLKRMEAVALYLEGVTAGVVLREERKMTAPVFIVRKCRTGMESFLTEDRRRNVIYTALARKLTDIGFADKERETYLKRSVDILNESIYPAYGKLMDKLRQLEIRSPREAGVWRLPRGDAYYRHCLRVHTSTPMAPGAIHGLGKKEVARIQRDLLDTFASLNIKGKSFKEALREYHRIHARWNRDRYYPNTEQGKGEALRDYKLIIRQLETELPHYFSRLPRARVTVAAVPDFKVGSVGSHYQHAMLDGSAPGVFYANLGNLPFRPGMRTLTVHEAVPGHHFQLALQAESAEVPLARNLMGFTAYAEGWALYAERLAYEAGFFKGPHEEIAYLRSQLLRAVRLVVDTGIHYKRWSRIEAYNYMVRNLGWGSFGSIDRYVVWPGQACAYKIGELVILELRRRAREALGKKFDLKQFHAAILHHGSMPLHLLKKHMEHELGLPKGKPIRLK